MFFKDWKKDIVTIPNLLSLFRLLLIPVYVRIYLHATEPSQFCIAGLILAVSCLTDALDGIIARRFHMITNLGKILDPIADKATQLALILCLSATHPILHWVLGLFLVKEVFQVGAGILELCRGKMLPGALPAGKVCTAVLFASLILLVVFPDMNRHLVSAIAALNAVFLMYSFSSYLSAYLGNRPKLQDI